MNNWKKVKLGTLCYRIGDGLHGTPIYDDNGTVFFINGNNLKNGKIIIDDETKKVSEDEFKSNYIELNENTLLLGINGTLGNMAFYNGENVMLGKSSAYLNFKTDINKFYFYYFQLPGVQKYFYDVATGSTIKNLSLGSLQNFEVPKPSESEYRKIAAVLSALDDKIELNNTINAELEAMAKTLYDYWFVQFEFPNSEGKPYKSSGGAMEYNPTLKREIPKGWEVKNLFECVNVQYGFPFSTDYFNETKTGIPIIRIRDILNNSISNYSTQENIDKKYLISEGDVLIGMDGNFHVNYWTRENCYLNQRVVMLKETFLPNIFIRYQVEPYIQLREKSVSRTTVGHLSDKDLKAINIIVPTNEILNVIKPLFDSTLKKIVKNKQQNQELAQLRDWLLPMLMNGQVKVVDAEEQAMSIAAEPNITYAKRSEKNKDDSKEERFRLWLSNQKLAARGDVDEVVLREIFDAMDDEDQ